MTNHVRELCHRLCAFLFEATKPSKRHGCKRTKNYLLAFLLHHIEEHAEAGQDCRVRANVIFINPPSQNIPGGHPKERRIHGNGN